MHKCKGRFKIQQAERLGTNLARLRNKCAKVLYITMDSSLIILAIIVLATIIITEWRLPIIIILLPWLIWYYREGLTIHVIITFSIYQLHNSSQKRANDLKKNGYSNLLIGSSIIFITRKRFVTWGLPASPSKALQPTEHIRKKKE